MTDKKLKIEVPEFEDKWYDDEPERVHLHDVYDERPHIFEGFANENSVEPFDDFSDIEPFLYEVNVLGTVYRIEFRDYEEDHWLRDYMIEGYTDPYNKLIVIENFHLAKYKGEDWVSVKGKVNHIIRHEIVHAFLAESGIYYEAWAKNEEMVNWVADMVSKIMTEYEGLGVVE